MSRGKYTVSILIVIFSLRIIPLFAVEGDFQPSAFVNALLNNQYLLESVRLTKLAEECYAQGEYDQAIKYAEEAMKYADWSDIYVTLQMKIKSANDAIAAAQTRLDWAAEVGAPKRYAVEYENAQVIFEDALIARSDEEWDPARENALKVLEILAIVEEIPTLPAQYLVKTWNPMKDCLWNIAGKPQIYGDPSKWRFIYDANKEKLSKPDNPNLIHPGMILEIPSINGEIRAGLWEEDDSVL
ncbi:MAG: LysM peptidoglycan-binding domain-containing protein [Treponema sp.]|jgi:tetratricopeptide (TPR) repeat protein|nr:LysM peptidoglycan-binding domain-containing protein [Treponema sp.]